LADLDDMFALIAAERRVPALSTVTQPTVEQAEAFINDGIDDLIAWLCPMRKDAQRWTVGRIDKLGPVLKREFVQITSPDGLEPAYPTSTPSICYFQSVRLGAQAAPVLAKEATAKEVMYERKAGSTYVPDAATPLYCFYQSCIFTAPAFSYPSGAEYHYVALPARMISTGAPETQVTGFPLGHDLLDVVMEYVMAMVWTQAKDFGRAMGRMQSYLNRVQELTGITMNQEPK
jgi:hypothetical protein